MTMTKFGEPCQYEKEFICFYPKGCIFTTAMECLRANLYLTQKELATLRNKRNLRHDMVSLRWRDQSFYYKKRAKYLLAWIKGQGLAPPIFEDSKVAYEKEVSNDGLHDNSQEGKYLTRRNTRTSHKGKSGNTPSGQAVLPVDVGHSSSSDIQQGVQEDRGTVQENKEV